MLYFDLGIYKEDFLSDREREMPSFWQNIIYYYRKLTGQVLRLKISGKELIILPKINKRVLKKVSKILDIDVTKRVCISEELKLKKEFINFLNSKNIKIFNGRWLFKYLMPDLIELLCNQSRIRIEVQEISILTNEINPLIFDSIKRISEKVKNVNIVTRNINLFKKLEREIYEESGLIIRVTNDFKKACLKSSIILNLNFVKEYLDKVNFTKSAMIVNFESKLKIRQKNFNGKVIDFYHINLPKRYLNNMERFSRFDSTIIYESLIYKKTASKNIWKELKEDNIKIDTLYGNNEKIKFLKNLSLKDRIN